MGCPVLHGTDNPGLEGNHRLWCGMIGRIPSAPRQFSFVDVGQAWGLAEPFKSTGEANAPAVRAEARSEVEGSSIDFGGQGRRLGPPAIVAVRNVNDPTLSDRTPEHGSGPVCAHGEVAFTRRRVERALERLRLLEVVTSGARLVNVEAACTVSSARREVQNPTVKFRAKFLALAIDGRAETDWRRLLAAD